MSILIRGMEMPTSCRACHLKINCEDCEGLECVCAPLHQQIGYLDDLLTDKRRDDCPLVPVPPHGDLIDRDALLDTATIHWSQTTNESCFPIDEIENAPTIIPASEENE